MDDTPVSVKEYVALMSKYGVDINELAKISEEEITANKSKLEYDYTAAAYEEFTKLIEYKTPVTLLKLLEENQAIKKNYKIVDIGAGTGFVAELLFKNGYNNDVYGTDISEKMLDIAREKNIYKEIKVADLTKETPFPSASFDLAICAGVSEVCPPGFLDVSSSLLKKGGYLVFSLANDRYEDSDSGYKAKIDNFGELELIAKVDFVAYKAVIDVGPANSKALLYRKL